MCERCDFSICLGAAFRLQLRSLNGMDKGALVFDLSTLSCVATVFLDSQGGGDGFTTACLESQSNH